VCTTAVPYGAVRAYITWRRIGGHLPCIVANMSGTLGSTAGPRMTYAEAETRVWVQQCAWFIEVIAGVGAPYAMVPFVSALIIIDKDEWT
jgi:hypothetical protein